MFNKGNSPTSVDFMLRAHTRRGYIILATYIELHIITYIKVIMILTVLAKKTEMTVPTVIPWIY